MVSIQENRSIQALNTFGIPANARFLAHITSLEDLQEVVKLSPLKSSRRLILGGGSNILFTKDFDGLILKVDVMGKTVHEENDDTVLVTVGAGENWHEFVRYCLGQNWGGIENLSLIPGTAGAAPIQNIGAYGVEIKNVLVYVDGLDLITGQPRRFNHDECRFGYRESVFKHDLHEKIFVSSITLRLTRRSHRLDTHYGAIQEVLRKHKIDRPTILDVSDAVIAIRRSKLPDPSVLGNAGSFFKNPTVDESLASDIRSRYPKMPSYPSDNQKVKIPAGWLIEACGWKGKRIGNVGVHDQQALVLINLGNGTGEEIFQLATKIQESVKEKFGIALTTEVNII